MIQAASLNEAVSSRLYLFLFWLFLLVQSAHSSHRPTNGGGGHYEAALLGGGGGRGSLQHAAQTRDAVPPARHLSWGLLGELKI